MARLMLFVLAFSLSATVAAENMTREARMAELEALACIDREIERFDDHISTASDIAKIVLTGCWGKMKAFNVIYFSEKDQRLLRAMWEEIATTQVLKVRVAKREEGGSQTTSQ